MEEYLKKHTTQAAYTTWLGSSDYVTPNVSLIAADGSLAYNPLIATSGYNMLDILWSDGTATTTIRPTSDNVTPIGLCVIPTGFLGTNEKARFMALKYAGGSSNGATVGTATGSTTYDNQYLQYTLSGAKGDILGITTYDTIDGTNTYGYLGDPEGNPISSGCGCGCGCGGSEPINIYTPTGTWYGLETANTFANHALGDIAGKENTAVVSALTLSNYPAFAACLQYYTPGTQAGDWYLPALGEFAFVCANKETINAKLTAINAVYPTLCMNSLYDNSCYWTSSEYSSENAYNVFLGNGYIDNCNEYIDYYVVPMLQV